MIIRRILTERIRSGIFLLILLSLLLGACDSGNNPTPIPVADRLQLFVWPNETQTGSQFDSLVTELARQRPDLSALNLTVASAAGADATSVLRNRMLTGAPPDSFATHVGSDLIDTWVRTDLMQPLDQLWRDQGWDTVYPRDLIDMISYDGSIYGVPLNVQRGNLLWYNKKIFADLGLEPPRTWQDVWAVSAKIKAAGITPVSLGSQDRWTVLDTFDSILLANAGPELYRELMTGRASWQDPKVMAALSDLRELFSLANASSNYLNWEGAVDFVYEGKAAMTIMGDWAIERFTVRGATLDKEYGWLPAPGTDGSFLVIADAYGLPKGVAHEQQALEFLKTIGTLPAQLALGKTLGAIPARTDVDRGPLDPYSAAAVESLMKDSLVPSSAHGSATPQLFTTRIQDLLANFLATGDLDTAQKGISEAASAILK